MPGIVTAWIVGEGIIFWRNWKQNSSFPVPGQLIAASFIFVLLAGLAEAPKAKGLATTMAWGFDIAALLNVLPNLFTGGTNTTASPLSSSSGNPVGAIAQQAANEANSLASNVTGGSVSGEGKSQPGSKTGSMGGIGGTGIR